MSVGVQMTESVWVPTPGTVPAAGESANVPATSRCFEDGAVP